MNTRKIELKAELPPALSGVHGSRTWPSANPGMSAMLARIAKVS
jgi:hypothetical protein